MGCIQSSHADDERLKIKWQSIEVIELVGQGGFGQVFKATWDKNRVAVKVLKPDCVTHELRHQLRQEARLMANLQHPRIARVYGLVDDEQGNLALVMQYYKNGTLYDYMMKHDTRVHYLELNIIDKVKLAFMVVRGMLYLHDHNVIHGDLKSSNILLDNTGAVVITDFGLSHVANKMGIAIERNSKKSNHKGYPMSIHTAAPEIIRNPSLPRSKECDVYSFAIVLLEILTAQPVYRSMTNSMIAHVVTCMPPPNNRPAIPPEVPEGVRGIIQLCWNDDPSLRPTFHEIGEMLDRVGQELILQAGEDIDKWQDTVSQVPLKFHTAHSTKY